MGYVPDGMTPAQWKKVQEEEKAKNSKKNFGAFGPQTFKSRSLQSFQKDLEKGKADHLLPVMNAKKLVKLGKINEEDIPYMQRGGAWDNSDLRTARKKQWSEDDKKYEQAEKKPFWAGADWSGRGAPTPRKTSNAAAQQAAKPKKKFGLW